MHYPENSKHIKVHKFKNVLLWQLCGRGVL